MMRLVNLLRLGTKLNRWLVEERECNDFIWIGKKFVFNKKIPLPKWLTDLMWRELKELIGLAGRREERRFYDFLDGYKRENDEFDELEEYLEDW